jgi:hypothetical protein
MIVHLVKKDLRRVWLLTLMFIVFCVLMCAVVFDSELLRESDYTQTSAMNLAGLLLNMLLFGNLMTVEKYEEKYSAYKIVAPLPVLDWEQVVGKFLIVLLSAAFGIIAVISIYKLFGIGNSWPGLRARYLLLTGSISLVLSGLCYVGIFKFGYHKMRAPIMALYILALIGPQLASFLQLVGEKESFHVAIGEASIPVVAGWILLSISLFAACLYASARVKESREI